MEIVKMEHVTKIYGEGNTRVWALDDVNLTVNKGEIVAVVGASGSGKSTLLHVMGGVDTPNEGNVIVDGKDITRLTDEEMSVFRRRKIGFVFQAYHLIGTDSRGKYQDADPARSQKAGSRLHRSYYRDVRSEGQTEASSKPVIWWTAAACSDCKSTGKSPGIDSCR